VWGVVDRCIQAWVFLVSNTGDREQSTPRTPQEKISWKEANLREGSWLHGSAASIVLGARFGLIGRETKVVTAG